MKPPCPLPEEREQEVLAPFSPGRRVGEGLPHFVRRGKYSCRRFTYVRYFILASRTFM